MDTEENRRELRGDNDQRRHPDIGTTRQQSNWRLNTSAHCQFIHNGLPCRIEEVSNGAAQNIRFL